MIPSQAMIMAAGFGVRLRPFTSRVPKAIMPVLGTACIEYTLAWLCHYGVKHMVINVHALQDVMVRYLHVLRKEYASKGITLSWSIEKEGLLGGAGGCQKALKDGLLRPEPFIICNADVMHHAPLDSLAAQHAQDGAAMTSLLMSKNIKVSSNQYTGVCWDKTTHHITSWQDASSRLFYAGVSIVHPDIFLSLRVLTPPQEFMACVFEPLSRGGKAFGYYWESTSWWDIGEPALWWHAHVDILHCMEKKTLPAYLQNFVQGVNQCVRPSVHEDETCGLWISKNTPLPEQAIQDVAGNAYVDAPNMLTPWRSASQSIAYHANPLKNTITFYDMIWVLEEKI